MFLLNGTDSIDGIGFARPADFHIRKGEFGHVLNGQLDHTIAMLGGSQRAWLFMRRIAGGNEEDAVQSKKLPG